MAEGVAVLGCSTMLVTEGVDTVAAISEEEEGTMVVATTTKVVLSSSMI